MQTERFEKMADIMNTNGLINTIKLDDVKGKLRLANAINAADSLNNHVNEWFTLVDVVQKPGIRSINNTECTDTYLCTKEGAVYFTQSEGIKNAAFFYASIFEGDFGDGIVVKCVEEKLDGGKTIKKLVAKI